MCPTLFGEWREDTGMVPSPWHNMPRVDRDSPQLREDSGTCFLGHHGDQFYFEQHLSTVLCRMQCFHKSSGCSSEPLREEHKILWSTYSEKKWSSSPNTSKLGNGEDHTGPPAPIHFMGKTSGLPSIENFAMKSSELQNGLWIAEYIAIYSTGPMHHRPLSTWCGLQESYQKSKKGHFNLKDMQSDSLRKASQSITSQWLTAFCYHKGASLDS